MYIFVDLEFRSIGVDIDMILLDIEMLEAFLDMAVFVALYLAFVLDSILLRERVSHHGVEYI